MKPQDRIRLALLVAASLLGPVQGNLMAQTTPTLQQMRTFTGEVTKAVSARYLLFLPRDYESSGSKRWPMILFLHGAGERGTNLALVAVHGPPKIVESKPGFPFIVVSPQCPAGQRWDNDVLTGLLDQVSKEYRVDHARIYLTGLSMGGFGTWNLGLAHPERFAAIAPICGGGDPLVLLLPDPNKREALRSLPVWAFHGARDQVVRLEESERMVNAMRRVGAQNVQLTVYPEAEHDSWTETYDNPKLYQWFMEHRR
jgi:predicted peptidase